MSMEQDLEERDLARFPVKQVFLNCVVIPSMVYIDKLMKDSKSIIYSIYPMIQLLSDLDPEDREDNRIKEADEKLQNIVTHGFRGTGANYMDLENIWRLITAHLHVYYFREFGVRAINPNPKHIRSEE
jgi:hypothetical protein